MWLENLKELKKEKGMTAKQIAEATNLPERTVSRIFSGDTDNPYVTTIHRIVSVLDGSLDMIFAESKVVVGNESLIELQANIDNLNSELAAIREENTALKDTLVKITAENDVLKTKLEHKEEIIALHNYYNNLRNCN